MPRRMSKSHDELRSDAVAAAHAMVRADGVAGLTVRRIAETIGCSVGTIYNLFLDLDDVVLHVAAVALDELHAAIFGPPLPEAPGAALEAMALRYLGFAEAEPRLWSMLFEHALATDRPLPAWHTERVARLVGAVHAHGEAAFSGTAEERLTAVDLLWASVHGIVALGMRDKLGFVTTESAPALIYGLILKFLKNPGL